MDRSERLRDLKERLAQAQSVQDLERLLDQDLQDRRSALVLARVQALEQVLQLALARVQDLAQELDLQQVPQVSLGLPQEFLVQMELEVQKGLEQQVQQALAVAEQQAEVAVFQQVEE